MPYLPDINLTQSQLDTILQLLHQYVPNKLVWAYGSRVKKTSTPTSDLDIVVFMDEKDSLPIYHLKMAFQESFLPFRVDVFVWNDVPVSFHENMIKNHRIFQLGLC